MMRPLVGNQSDELTYIEQDSTEFVAEGKLPHSGKIRGKYRTTVKEGKEGWSDD